MTKEAEAARNEIMEVFDRVVEKLPPIDYYELMEEIQGALQCRMDCVKEENPGDFE